MRTEPIDAVSEADDPGQAAIAPRVNAELYGLDILAADIADHDGNQTRFVLVAKDGIPKATGHDKTALVIYQRADEPGSLISILQEFEHVTEAAVVDLGEDCRRLLRRHLADEENPFLGANERKQVRDF